MNTIPPRPADLVARRWFLQQCGVGLGSIALAHLLAADGYAVPAAGPPAAEDPLAPRGPHFAPKAKRVIFLFMAGAPSHLELFDYKPKLAALDGQLPPPDLIRGYRAAFINPAPASWARASSSPGTAGAAPSCPNSCRTPPPSPTTSPSCGRWSPTPSTTPRVR
jgi:hypothetical protein